MSGTGRPGGTAFVFARACKTHMRDSRLARSFSMAIRSSASLACGSSGTALTCLSHMHRTAGRERWEPVAQGPRTTPTLIAYLHVSRLIYQLVGLGPVGRGVGRPADRAGFVGSHSWGRDDLPPTTQALRFSLTYTSSPSFLRRFLTTALGVFRGNYQQSLHCRCMTHAILSVALIHAFLIMYVSAYKFGLH